MEIESKIYNFSKTKIYIFPGKMHFTSINRLLKLFNYNFSVWIIWRLINKGNKTTFYVNNHWKNL